MTNRNKSAVDIALYVALAEEFTTVKKELGNQFEPFELPDIALTCFLGSIWSAPLNRAFKILVVPAGKMGNIRSANVTSAVLSKFDIRNLVSIGIAGSLVDELQPGDVLVPDRVNEYLANSAASGTETWDFQTSGNQFVTDPRLLNRFQAHHENLSKTWRRNARERFRKILDLDEKALTTLRDAELKMRPQPMIYSGDDRILASGPAVGKGKAFVDWLKKVDRKAVAIEMESAGVYDAALIRTPAPKAIAIRGISDFADERKAILERVTTGGFRAAAAKNATSLFVSAVQAGLFKEDSPTSRVSIPHQLERPPLAFVGRETEINDLVAAAKNGPVCISGLGGIGKTALAVKIGERLTPHFPDGQIQLDLKGARHGDSTQTGLPLTPDQAMAYVITHLAGEERPTDSQGLEGLYRSVLYGKRVLLLMDNALDKAQVEPLIPHATCALIVTSRANIALGSLSRHLEMLPAVQAQELLRKIAPRIGAADAITLADLCGCWPLALDTVARTLVKHPDLTPIELIARMRDAQRRLKETGVTLALTTSSELLTSEIRHCWLLLGVFPSTFEIRTAADLWQTNEGQAKDTLSELVSYNLVEWTRDPFSISQLYRLHDLVRDFAASAVVQSSQAEYFKEVADEVRRLCGAEGARLIGKPDDWTMDLDFVSGLWAARKRNERLAQAKYKSAQESARAGDTATAIYKATSALALYHQAQYHSQASAVREAIAQWRKLK